MVAGLWLFAPGFLVMLVAFGLFAKLGERLAKRLLGLSATLFLVAFAFFLFFVVVPLVAPEMIGT
jgi:hypothetical protein